MLGTFVLAYTTPTKTLKSRISPARMPAIIFSRRRRPCCLLLAAFPFVVPFVVPFFVPAGRRAALPPAREDDVPPDREAVVPPRPPAGGRPDPADPRPPPPVLGVRTGAGRRTDPARGATDEVSSWDGTRNPSLTGRCDESVSATGTFACRSVASSAVHAREDRGAAAHGRCSRDGRVRGDRRAQPGGTTPLPPGAGSCGADDPAQARFPERTRRPGDSSRSYGTPRRCTRRTPPGRRPSERARPRSWPGRPWDRGGRRTRSSPA